MIDRNEQKVPILMQNNEKVEELLERTAKAAIDVVEEVVKAIRQIAEEIAPIIYEFAIAASATAKNIYSQYPNRRVVWLALHHKRERVRKKNIRRIMRWVQSDIV